MGAWSLLGRILEEVHIHSTMVSKLWLTILFIFRMLVLGIAAGEIWEDEQSGFICNTEQPGCRNACYDQAFPISLIRYWALQMVFVSSPSLCYMGHALYRLRVLGKERRRMKAHLEPERVGFETSGDQRNLEPELWQLGQRKRSKAPLPEALLCTYVIHVLTRSVLEVSFMIGQYLLYGFHLQPLFKCHRQPCPNIIDCFVSRPTEKTIFLLFMQSIATVSLFLSILEIFYLGFKKIKRGLWGQSKWKGEHKEFHANQSKQNQRAPAKSPKRLPPAPGHLSAEKQTHRAVHPSLNPSPPFQADPGSHSVNDQQCALDEPGAVFSDKMRSLHTAYSHLQHIRSNHSKDPHKTFGKAANGNQLREKRATDGQDSQRNHCSRGHCSVSSVAGDLDNYTERLPQAGVSLPANHTWKPRWLSATRGPSTEGGNWRSPPNGHLIPNGNLEGQFLEGTTSTFPPSQGNSQLLPVPQGPCSLREPSCEPGLVRPCNNPVCPPNPAVSLTNSLAGRRLPTDLQI
ncbi:gap junction alpha-9 protein [Oryctolagus cuniculus]|uniref:Gap junction protein n=1 Tax=Oryctolagus cuniculus TaxID=9986 RepID=G1TBS7_RABIT|nr:gap junction alpha-9 protein [Oryctolagus cuniculus]VZP20243.1 TPA: connexin M [Oryctolagus cuniculus]